MDDVTELAVCRAWVDTYLERYALAMSARDPRAMGHWSRRLAATREWLRELIGADRVNPPAEVRTDAADSSL